MHPTADTSAVMYIESRGAAGDARVKLRPSSHDPGGVMPPEGAAKVSGDYG